MHVYTLYTVWLFNIAMENGPFINDFPIKTSIYGWDFPWQTVSHNQMVMFVMDPNAITWQFGIVYDGWIACLWYPLLLVCRVFFSPLMCWI